MKHILYFSFGISLSFLSINLFVSKEFRLFNLVIAFLPLVTSIVTCFFEKLFKALPVITNAIALIYLTVFHRNQIIIDTFSLTSLVYFLVLIVFSIASYRINQNEAFGIRTPATLKYKEVWDRTHKFFSSTICIFIPFCYTLIFWYSSWLRFILANVSLLLPCIIGIVYSHIISKPIIDADYKKCQNELLYQQKLEEEGKLK